MAKIQLELEAANTDALTEMANGYTKVSTESKKATEEQKKFAKEASDSFENLNKKMSSKDPVVNLTKQKDAIQQLKQQIRDYESAAIKAGEGTAAFAKNIELAGRKKAELKDLRDAITALDPDRVAAGFLSLGQSIAGGFTLAQSAIALTGSRSEELEKTLLRVQAAQGVLAGLQQLANSRDEIAKVKIIALQKLQTLEIQKGIVATEGATVAQRIWNLVTASNPFLLLFTALTAVVGIISVYVSETKNATEAEKERSKAIDGTIIKNKELRDAYNENIITVKELENEYAVLNGTITDLDANIDNLKTRYTAAVTEINNETSAKLVEAGGVFNKFWNFVKGGGTAVGFAQETINETTKIAEAAADKTKILELKLQTDLAKAKLEQDKKDKETDNQAVKKAAEDRKKIEKDLLDELKNLRDKAREEEINQLSGSSRVLAEFENNRRIIDDLEKTLIKKGKLLDADFKLGEEQLKQFGILRAANEKEALDKLNKITSDANFKDVENRKQAEQDSIDIANQFIDENLKALQEAEQSKILITKEGSKERLNAEIEAIEKERDFILANTQLTVDQQTIIIEQAKDKIDALNKGFATTGFSISKLLGITPEALKELDQYESAFKSFTDSIASIINQQIAREQEALNERKKINDEIIRSNESRISDLNGQLKTELELNKQGLASNTTAIKDQLKQATDAKNKALEEDKRIQKEQAKIARQKAAAEAIQQTSALLTAGANIFKINSEIPVVGVILALAQVASLVAGFIALQSSVKKATEGFYKGGYTGDGDKYEEAGPAHKGEFVSNQETTKKYRSLLEAMHTEDWSKVKPIDLAPLLAGTGVSLMPDISERVNNNMQKENEVKQKNDERILQAIISAKKEMAGYFSYQKKKPQTETLPDGRIAIKTGNTTRIIKNG